MLSPFTCAFNLGVCEVLRQTTTDTGDFRWSQCRTIAGEAGMLTGPTAGNSEGGKFRVISNK